MILINMTVKEIQEAEKILDVLLILERVCEHEGLPKPTISGAMLQGRVGECTEGMLDTLIDMFERQGQPTLEIFQEAKVRIAHLLVATKREKGLEDFKALCSVEENDCWIQEGGPKRVTYKGRSMSIRKALWISGGRGNAPGYQILSTCGNKMCVNPTHCEAKPINKNRNKTAETRRVETQPDAALLSMSWI